MAGEEKQTGGTDAPQAIPAPTPMPPAGQPEPEVRGPSLGERARHGIRANRWAGVVLIALGLAVGGWWWAQQEELLVAPSRLGTGSTVTANPLEGTSPAYEKAMDEGEQARRTEAVESGESFLEALQSGQSLLEEQGAEPVLPDRQPPSAATQETPDQPPEEDDALVRRDYPTPEPRDPVVLRSEAPAPAPAVAIDAMLEELIAAWSAAPQMTVIRYEQEAEDGAGRQAATGAPGPQGSAAGATETVLVPAGRMVYAATKVGVDSELALPVLVEVLERPFTGALLRGEFQQVRDRMLVRFTRLSDERKGLDVAVNAYAVGLECECGAVDGEVDRHWISRVILPAAFGFAQEYLAAASQPQVTVSVDGQVVSQQYDSDGRERVARGLAGALGQTGDVVFESLPRSATVRLPRGTEFAVVFVDPVKVEAG